MKRPANAGNFPNDGGSECKGKHSRHYTTNQYERAKSMSEITEKKTGIELPEGFVIDSDRLAVWAIRKIKERRAERDEFISWYQQKIKEITEQTDFDTMKLERMLSDYFATVKHRKTKTTEVYDLPEGKLVLKVQNPEFKRDDKTVIDWLKKNNMTNFVKTKEELAWSDLKGATDIFEGRIVTEDGEIVPGIEVVEREPKFIVEV
jgi:phage host-nuclease inhibitor protein Gam